LGTKLNPRFEQQTLFSGHRRGQWMCQYRAPNLLVSRAGTVFAFPHASLDGIADHAKGELVYRRSFDHGQTWTDTTQLRSDENPRIGFGFNSGVADLETGGVLVFFSVNVVIQPKDIGGQWVEQWVNEHPQEAADLRKRLAPNVDHGLYLISTDDEGETWSEPQPMHDTLHIVHPMTGEKRRFGPQWTGTQLRYGAHKGRLILPGRGMTRAEPFDLSAYSHNYVVYSDDHGRTWQPGGLAQNGTGEACLVEEIDGTVYLNSRNESLRGRGYRAWDRSHDGGSTFVESGYDLQLPEPHCQASMVRFSGPEEGGSRVLFCNPAVWSGVPSHYDIEGRRNLTVYLSYDECRTWPVARTVCAGGAGYSAIAVANNGDILCLYETIGPVGDRLHYTGELVLARFNLEWLRAEEARGQPFKAPFHPQLDPKYQSDRSEREQR